MLPQQYCQRIVTVYMVPLRNDVICTTNTLHSHLGMVVWGVEQCIADPSVLTSISHAFHTGNAQWVYYPVSCISSNYTLRVRNATILSFKGRTKFLQGINGRQQQQQHLKH